MAVSDTHVFPGFLTPVLTLLFFSKPPTTFLRGERQKKAGKKSCLNRGSNSQPPGHEFDMLTTEPPGRGIESSVWRSDWKFCVVWSFAYSTKQSRYISISVVFTEPASGEQNIVVTMTVWCMCVHLCKCLFEFVLTLTSTIVKGFQNNLT